MDGTFNGQILVEKLAKLNSSQQSIETLSHWCIFHRKKAKQVVETWDQQFHCSPQEQRVSFLYLANDILQNSRRKGFEFVGEFWKVLPRALSDVFKNGDEFGRNAALRLVDIWDDRKVFGSRGQLLKEELLGKKTENRTKNGNAFDTKLKQPCGDAFEKLVSSYKDVNDDPVDDDLFERCQTAIKCVAKVEEEIGNDFNLGSLRGSRVVEELQEQHNTLRECIQQLIAVESSRIALVSHLNKAIHEEEAKVEQVRSQLQVAQSRFEQVGAICQQLLSCNSGQLASDQMLNETPLTFSEAPPSFVAEPQASAGDKEQSTPVRYSQHSPFPESSPRTEGENRKLTAAAVAAKLTASTSSAQMLSFVLSSLASEGATSQLAKEDYPSETKRPKLENGTAPYIPPQPQPPPPPFPHPDSLRQPPPPPLQTSSSPMSQPSHTVQPLMPPNMSPVALPPASQFMQNAGLMTSFPFTYSSAFPPRGAPPLPAYPMMGMPPYPGGPLGSYNNFQTPDGVGLFNHQSMPATPPPVSRQ